jgi:pyruvate,orthophosphate dikinase
VEEGIIDRLQALERLREIPLQGVRQPKLDIPPNVEPVARGEVASIGSLSGKIAVSSEESRRMSRQGVAVILVRPETRTEDLQGIIAADGIITARGGRTSHAAVVARHLGKACITGCSQLEIDEAKETVRAGGVELSQGDWISIDGRTGDIYAGRFESRWEEEEDPAVETIRKWARELGCKNHPLLDASATQK